MDDFSTERLTPSVLSNNMKDLPRVRRRFRHRGGNLGCERTLFPKSNEKSKSEQLDADGRQAQPERLMQKSKDDSPPREFIASIWYNVCDRPVAFPVCWLRFPLPPKYKVVYSSIKPVLHQFCLQLRFRAMYLRVFSCSRDGWSTTW